MENFNWNEYIDGLFNLGYILFGMVASALVYFFSKKLADLKYSKKVTEIEESVREVYNLRIEDHKSELSRSVEIQLKPIQAELDKKNISHQIQLSYLHEKRGEAIIQLYQKLVELHSALADLTRTMRHMQKNPQTAQKEREERAWKALTDFGNFYLNHKIFFSKSLCTSIEKVKDSFWDKTFDYGWWYDWDKQAIEKGESRDNTLKELIKITKEVREKIPLQISQLEDMFRKLLDVKD